MSFGFGFQYGFSHKNQTAGGVAGDLSVSYATTENLGAVENSGLHLDPFVGGRADSEGSVITSVDVLAQGRIALNVHNGDGNAQRWLRIPKTGVDGEEWIFYIGRWRKDGGQPEAFFESSVNIDHVDEQLYFTLFEELVDGEPTADQIIAVSAAALNDLKAAGIVLIVEDASGPIRYAAGDNYAATAANVDYHAYCSITTDLDMQEFIEQRAQDDRVAIHVGYTNGANSVELAGPTNILNPNNSHWTITAPAGEPHYTQLVHYKRQNDGSLEFDRMEAPVESTPGFPVAPPVEPQGLQKLYSMAAMFGGLQSGQPAAANDFASRFRDGLASGMAVGNPPAARPGIVDRTVSGSTAGFWNVPANFRAGYSGSTGPANNTPLDLPYMFYESSSPSSIENINGNGWADIELDGGTATGWLDGVTRDGIEYDSKNWFSNTGLSERKLELVWNLTTSTINKSLMVQELDADGNIIAGVDRTDPAGTVFTAQRINALFYGENESFTELFGSWVHSATLAGTSVQAEGTQVGNALWQTQELVTLYDGGWAQQIIPIHADTRKIRLRLKAAGQSYQNDLAFAEIALHGTPSGAGGDERNHGPNQGPNWG